MATADDYAAWIVKNQDKQGTPEFETVAKAFHEARAQEATPAATGRSADYMRGRTEAGGATRGLMSVLNGPTFGFGDEILGALGGAWDSIRKGGSFLDNYKANRDYVRGAQDVEQENNPWTTGITQAMASAPTTMLKLPGTLWKAPSLLQAAPKAAMGVLPQAGRAAASGAAYGALSGAGNSTAEDFSGVAGDAAQGAAFGGATAGAVAPVARGVKAVAGNVAARVNNSAAAAYAREKIAEALARDAAGTTFAAGGGNPITQAGARLRSIGDPAVLADAGGQNTRQLLDTLVTLPGATKEAAANMIRERQATRAGRLIDAADNAMGTKGARLAPTLEDLIAQRSKASTPLYQQVRKIVIDEPSEALQQIVANAHELGAGSTAQKIALGRMQQYTLDPKMPFGWKLGDLDNLKRGLDTIISGQTNEMGKVTPLGAAVMELKQALVHELDGITTDPKTKQSIYKMARDTFAGPSALIDAARLGRTAITKDEASIYDMVKGLSGSEMDAFRVGAFEGLRNKLGNSDGGRTEVLNLWKNPTMREKLQALFGNERAFREFAAAAAKENRLKTLETVGQGSQTAARQFAAGDLDAPALQGVGAALHGVAQGNPMSVLQGATNVWNRVKTPEPVRDQMGRILLSSGDDARANLGGLNGLLKKINEQRAQEARSLGLLGLMAP